MWPSSAWYDDTLWSLTGIHAPLVKVTRQQRNTAPWYNDECRPVKTDTRRLERVHRRFRSSHAFEACKQQFRFLWNYLQEQYKDYWTMTITANLTNYKLLWSKVSSLLQEDLASDEWSHSADEMTLRHSSVERLKKLSNRRSMHRKKLINGNIRQSWMRSDQ